MDIKVTNNELLIELTNEFKAEDQRRQYSWISGAEGISWNAFSVAFPKHRLWFYTLLDISDDEATGWQQVCINLGLSTEDIKWCSKFCGPAGPTATAFSKLDRQLAPVSLHALLHHLVWLGRHDLLLRVPWAACVDQLTPHLLKQLPQELHSVPLQSSSTQRSAAALPLLSAAADGGQRRAKYACSVLILYADDAAHFAKKVISQLRQSVPGRDRIGVLVLPEQRHLLMQDPHTLLYKWFMQVDYIVPVLSPELLQQMTDWAPVHMSPDPMASLHHRYLYRLTLDQYVANACRNLRCRPVCGTRHTKQVWSSEHVQNQGLLQVVTVCQEYLAADATNGNQSVESFAHLLLRSPAALK